MTAFVLFWSLLISVSHLPPLTLKLLPAVCLAPCTLRATVHFERHYDDEGQQIQQAITLALESDDFSRYSAMNVTLHPKTFQVKYDDLPQGEYLYTVTLYERGESVAMERRPLSVS